MFPGFFALYPYIYPSTLCLKLIYTLRLNIKTPSSLFCDYSLLPI